MIFDPYLTRWKLTPDGEPVHTHSSDLLPVRQSNTPAMLKIPRDAEEKRGGGLMVWWNGAGAAHVLEHDADTGALLLERAMGTRSLVQMAQNGQDDQASRILCQCLNTLHAPPIQPLPELVPLWRWFHDLAHIAKTDGGIFALSWKTAESLLSDPQEETILHGDTHHANFLDFGPERGWLAIDPKGLWGERGFDYANIFCNPNDAAVTTAPGRLARQAEVIARAAHLDPRRLLQWVLAYAGLSVAWMLADGITPGHSLEVAYLAAEALNVNGANGI